MRRPVIVLLLILAVSGLYAQEDETLTTTTAGLTSQSVFRGVKQSGVGAEGTFQVARNGWRTGMEIDQPFDRNEPRIGNLQAAYAWKASERLKIEALVTQRWYSEVSPAAAKNAFEAELSGTWSLPEGFLLELAYFHDCRIQADTLQATVNYSMPLKSLGAYLEWSASIGTSSARDLMPEAVGTPIRDSYTYYMGSVRLPYRIGAHTLIITGLHIAESDGQSRFWSPMAASGGFRAWADLGLSFDF